MDSSPNFDNVIYIFICENPSFFKLVDPPFFRNIYVNRLYKITKAYWNTFDSVPFDVDNPSIDTLREIAYRNIDEIITDPALDKEKNLEMFVTNMEHIVLHTEYKKWDKSFLTQSIETWVELANFERGLALSSELIKTGDRSPNNIPKLLGDARALLNRRTNIVLHDQESKDFLDPESHKQIDPQDLINTGFKNLNMWLSGNPSGGFEPGTSTIFIGESNIGKSIWLGCLAYNMFLSGNNVLLVSLEMSVEKLFKRIGSNAFDISIGDYGKVSSDLSMMSDTIKKFKKKYGSELIPPGNLRSVKFSSASVKDIEVFAQREEKRLGIRWNAIVVDYMTELESSHGISQDKMYQYHKMNSSELFRMAGDNYWASVTAHQLKGDDFGKDDLTMLSMGESRGIAHRTDNIIGIIQTPTMRHECKYYLKCIKPRDGAYKNWKNMYKINYDHMRLVENDEMIQPNDFMIEGS